MMGLAQMDAATIQAQIRRYELRIISLEQENTALRGKIDRLNQAEYGYQQKQQSYYEYVWAEQAQANRVKALSQIRIADSYADSLLSLCSSGTSLLAGDGFAGIMTKLKDARQRMEDEMRSNNSMIASLRQEIGYLRNRLYSLS
jgi:predicted  nucleic acid-binding Zn-ribbon protein